MVSTANVPKVDRVAQQGTAPISQSQTNNVPQARFTWKIVNFSTLRQREICSDPFQFGGYKWRLIIFPKGGNETCLSIYLEVANSATLPHGWRIDTRFGLAVINQTNNKLTVRTEAQHEFYASKSDWGFPSFMPLRELNDSSRGFLVNDSCIIEAYVAANLFTIVKVARDADFVEQIGKDVYFDLVDFESVRSFHIKKQMPFYLFKELVAKEFGVPVQFQRFWMWARRMNETYRPLRPLTSEEEIYTVEKLKNISNKTQMGELKLFLEVEFGLDQSHVPPPHKTEIDILLFLKLYDPKNKELRYIGRLFVNCHSKVSQITTKVNLMAGFDPDEDIQFYEEIKYEPFVMCEAIDDKVSWRKNEIEGGDIICFQKASSHEKEQYQYPCVPSFLNYVHSRQIIHLRHLSKPTDEDFSLELSKELDTYDDVVKKIAHRLGVDDPNKIRLTPHDCHSQQPKPQPVKYQSAKRLQDLLIHDNQFTAILYYEVVDTPFPEFQCLTTSQTAQKTLEVDIPENLGHVEARVEPSVVPATEKRKDPGPLAALLAKKARVSTTEPKSLLQEKDYVTHLIKSLLQENDFSRIDDQAPDVIVEQALKSSLESFVGMHQATLKYKIQIDSQSKKLEDLQVANKSLLIAKTEAENALKAAEEKTYVVEAKAASQEAELEELRVQLKAKEEELVQEKALRVSEVDDVGKKAREKALEEFGAEVGGLVNKYHFDCHIRTLTLAGLEPRDPRWYDMAFPFDGPTPPLKFPWEDERGSDGEPATVTS